LSQKKQSTRRKVIDKTLDNNYCSFEHNTNTNLKQETVRTTMSTNKKVNGGKSRPVLVTTEHRGVFFGYAEDTDGETIELKKARLCIYWSKDVKGFMGLAANGPSVNCRIGPPAEITLRKITAVAEVTPTAVEAWEKAPWG
jgi:hypothetical protein